MELLKLDERPAEFQWKDVTFFYRKTVTPEDKFSIDTSGTHLQGDKIEFNPWEFYKTMIRVFVVGWRGVTEGGKEVAYSYETFLKRIPVTDKDDIIMLLGKEIAYGTGVLDLEKAKENGQIKNG